MKTLIINGSPRKNGDTASLLKEMKNHLKGEITKISTYYDNVSPCIDCRYCWENGACCIKDDMDLIYNADFDNLVIVSPLHYSIFSGPLLNLAGRLQVYAPQVNRGLTKTLKAKNGGLIIVGGGNGTPSKAIDLANVIFRRVNATYTDGDTIFSLKTDEVPASKDRIALAKVKQLAHKLNSSGK